MEFLCYDRTYKQTVIVTLYKRVAWEPSVVQVTSLSGRFPALIRFYREIQFFAV